MSCCCSSSVSVWPSPAVQPKENTSKRKSTSCDSCGGLACLVCLSCSPFIFWFLRRAELLFWEEGGTFTLYFCSLSNSIYGLLEISNAWRNRHLLLPPAPVCIPSQSQFLSGLSFRLSPSPVLCQAGRLVLWGQTKGWASLRPVSRSANRHHGSLGRRH